MGRSVLVSQNAPEVHGREIERENILATLDTLLEGDTRIAVVEGPSGRGKSVLLRQYAERHTQRAVAIFISGESRWSYDVGQIRFDICNQLNWLLRKSELASFSDATDPLLGILLHEARRTVRKTRAPFLFVIDGMHEVPVEDVGSRRQIAELLPLGETSFRFVFSGDAAALGLREKQRMEARPYLLTLFSLDETSKFLSELGLTDSDVGEIYKVTNGAPRFLSSVRRLVESGVSVRSLLDDLPLRLPEPFDLEWRHVTLGDPVQKKLLAILAHDLRTYTVRKLSNLAGVSPDAIYDSLSRLTFLSLGPEESSEIRFVADDFKRYAAQKLADEQDAVRQLLISVLLRDPQGEESRDLLPTYLRDAGQLEELVGYLTLDYFAAYVRNSSSLAGVQRSADIGIGAAKALHRDGDLVRLTLQKATIAEFDESGAGRAELRALAALGDHELALAIAQGARRVEDRLLLLAALARSRREAKMPVPDEVEEQILQLHDTADFTVLGERSETLAADLMYVRPDLALKTVEKANESRLTNGTLQQTDWRYARLAIEARLVARDTGRSPEQVTEILGKIKHPKARRLAAEASVVFGDVSAKTTITEAAKLPTTEDQVYVLRQWVLANRTRGDAAEVLEHALTLAIRSTDYTPSALHLRELASCLPYLKDEGTARRLIGILDGQAPIVRNIGPTEDYVRLQLIVSRAEFAFDTDAARNRVVDLYLMISSLDDFGIKVVSTARFLAALSKLDPTRLLEEREGLHGIAETEFKERIKVLLETSADHYEAAESVIRALAINRPDLALELASQLNTEPRRDMGYRDLVETALTVPIEEIRLDIISEAMGRIQDVDARDDALTKVISRVAGNKCTGTRLRNIIPFLEAANKIGDPKDRVESAAKAAAFLAIQEDEEYAAVAVKLLSTTRQAWATIDEAWTRITAGFDVAVTLAKAFPDEAREFVSKAGDLREAVPLYSDASATGVIWCLRLAIRAFAGLVPQNLATAAEKERLQNAIARIPSVATRLGLWADLAERYSINEHTAECREIVEKRIKPGLAELEQTALSDWFHATTRCAPALYIAHPATALAIIDKLPRGWRDEALFNVTDFIKRKCPLTDPFESRGREGYDLTYNDAVDLCDLAERIDQDAAVYYVAEDIVDSLANSKTKLSRQQKGAISQRLTKLAETKFPNPRFIKHGGWKVALRAQVARLSPPDRTGWTELVASARQIPNAADRAYVLSIVASAIRDPRDRNPVIAEAVAAIEGIPMLVDKVDHYRITGGLLVGVDRAASKEYLRKGLQYSLAGKGRRILNSRREIVDLAYRIDPEFASKLASDIDDDPVKDRLKRQISLHELKKSMAKERSDFSADDMEDFDYSRAAWMRLASLNAGRVDHVPMDTALRYLDFASRQSLSRAYPIFALLVENAVRRHSKSDNARRSVSPLFEGSLLGAELAIHASARAKAATQAGLSVVRERATGQTLVINPGDREVALEFLSHWIEQNVGDYLKIADPYFRPDDLEVLRLVKAINPSCVISILTSKRAQLDVGLPQPWEESYNAAWLQLSDDPPPATDIVVVGSRNSGSGPIHDRWWLTNGTGLEIGTSFGSIGGGKATSIRVMDDSEAAAKEQLIDQFLINMIREYGEDRYVYTTLVLGT